MASPAHSRKPILHPHGKVRMDSLSRLRTARPPASPAKQSGKTCGALASLPASAQSLQQGRGSPPASHPPPRLEESWAPALLAPLHPRLSLRAPDSGRGSPSRAAPRGAASRGGPGPESAAIRTLGRALLAPLNTERSEDGRKWLSAG